MKQNNFSVYLRALEPDDYKTTIKWRNDSEIWSLVGGPKYFVSSDFEKEWINNAIHNSKEIKLGICLKENNELIGFVSIIDIDWINRSARSPIMLGDKKYWGKGLATEALLLILKFAFYERGLNRIWGHILENNRGSQKVYLKCGYKKEGVFRSSIYKNGKYQNQVILSVLREDFDVLDHDNLL